MDFVRSHSPGQSVALMAVLTAVVMACSSSSTPAGLDAGTDTGTKPPQDSGSDATSDGGGDSSASCTPSSFQCESFTVCCNGGTCVPTGQGDSVCTVADAPPPECLLTGEPCSSSKPCCMGAGNCGEGTTNTCL
jgi:hypothetical protein